jgi:hypothetical protein
MNRTYPLAALLAVLGMGCNASTAAGPDESLEPPLEFVVNVGDKSISIGEGKTGQLEGSFTNPKVTVTPQPYRTFPYQGIRFRYPRSFAFEADFSEPDARNWTLSGNDLKIMFFVLNAPLTPEGFANNMLDQFGRENGKITNASAKITLGKETLTGTTAQITVVTHTMVLEAYSIPSRKGGTKLLVLQDSLDDAGNRSKESTQALKEIKASFTIEK